MAHQVANPGFTTLYRLFTAEGTLLYVGISGLSEARIFCQHYVDKAWFREVERVTLEHFETRYQAEQAEIRAIGREAPLYNIAHNYMPSGRRQDAWELLESRVEQRKEELAWAES